MIDITAKQISLRTARAQGRVLCDETVQERIKNDDLPKGNLFDIARAAGLLAAKNTQNLIPHCHPVSIDGLSLDFEVDNQGVRIECEGKSIGRTGIEMEVLTAVSVAALTVYDLLKPLKKEIEISGIKLLEKTGGRSGLKKFTGRKLNAAILVASDSTAAGKREDKSGKKIREILETYNVEIKDYQILPDEPAQIKSLLNSWLDEKVQFIFTTGGTGLGPRDRTVEAVRELIERDAPGITEAMRKFGQDRTPLAMLSRQIAGAAKESIIVTLPGSSKGAAESLQSILPALFHGGLMVMGGGHGE